MMDFWAFERLPLRISYVPDYEEARIWSMFETYLYFVDIYGTIPLKPYGELIVYKEGSIDLEGHMSGLVDSKFMEVKEFKRKYAEYTREEKILDGLEIGGQDEK